MLCCTHRHPVRWQGHVVVLVRVLTRPIDVHSPSRAAAHEERSALLDGLSPPSRRSYAALSSAVLWRGRSFSRVYRHPFLEANRLGQLRLLNRSPRDGEADARSSNNGSRIAPEIHQSKDMSTETNARGTPTSNQESSHDPTLPRFGDLKLHDRLREALSRRLGDSGGVNLDTQLTDVQHQVWMAVARGSSAPTTPAMLLRKEQHVDVIARARTGTGKTLAYLLPALNRLFHEQDQQRGDVVARRRGVRMVVLSPTRELARQIYQVAVGLTTPRAPVAKETSWPDSFSQTAASTEVVPGEEDDRRASIEGAGLHCQVLHGGVPRRVDLDAFHQAVPDVLIATPGRLLDHITSTYVETDGMGDGQHDRKPFSSFLQSVSVLVIDEVDRLLDMGFLDDISIILNQLPVHRQTFLLSATLPTSVRDVMLQHVHPTNHVVLDCVGSDFANGWDDQHAAAKTVKQSYAIIPMNRTVSGVVDVILHLLKTRRGERERRANVGNKLLVFFPTTSQVTFFSCLLNQHLGRHAWELHSGMSQSQRQIASDAFRCATSGVLLTTDVSARGVDYPRVSHVIQVGMARNRETYLHRLGRTGRAGKWGKGILLLLEPELGYLKQELSGLTVGRNPSLQQLLDRPTSARLQSDLLQIAHDLRHGHAEALNEHAESCYRSLLSYYYSRLGNSPTSRVDAAVDIANAFSYEVGLPELPAVPARIAMQYGMLNHPKLNIDQRWTIGTRFDVGTSTTNFHGDEAGASNAILNPEASELWSNEEKLD